MSGPRLHLGERLWLPEDAVTETFVLLGKRGSGKTTTARVLVEELLSHGLPAVVLDPTGVWWGLRSSADGRGDGFPVVIFGGDHADVPLEETAGVAESQPISTGEVVAMWRSVLRAGARRMLDVLLEHHPRPLTRDQLAAAVEMAADGGTFGTYLSTLRRNGLADTHADGSITADAALFLIPADAPH